jgi:ribosomal protein L11 methyltransferase
MSFFTLWALRARVIPYDNLYIYEISGEIRHGDEQFPADYIGTWWEGDHSFVFFSRERDEFIQSILRDYPSFQLIDRFAIDYREWQAGDEIGLVRIGELAFMPPWQKAAPPAGEQAILLDPSVVFGSGLHPTTHDCLEALCEVYKRDRPKTVIDLGTGTGILALACARLGAERVLAVDYNPLAVRTAEKNVKINEEERRVEVLRGKAEDLIREPADLVCCNLYFHVLNQLLDTEEFFQKRRTILSGFFHSEEEVIIQRLRRRGVQVDLVSSDNRWQTILGFNPGAESLPRSES